LRNRTRGEQEKKREEEEEEEERIEWHEWGRGGGEVERKRVRALI